MKTKPDSYVAPTDTIRAAFAGAGADDVAFLARRCLEIGAWDQALAVCEALGDGTAPGVELCRAVASFVGGDAPAGLEIVERVLARSPGHLSAMAVKAQMLARTGDRDGARELLLELVARYPDYPAAQGLLATLVMPGPHYREVLSRLHDRLRPRSYLEIGVESGATLALARHAQIAIGVDPSDAAVTSQLSPATRLFREESDAFFAAHSKQELLGARRLDLVFIDGLHLFEQALRDFRHAETWAHADATIVFHDCVPIVPGTSSRVRQTKFWVGDTWKVVLALAAFRPELRIRTLLAPPSGLVVVRRLNPGSRVLFDRYEEIVTRFESEAWTHAPGNYPAEIGALPNDDVGFEAALG